MATQFKIQVDIGGVKVEEIRSLVNQLTNALQGIPDLFPRAFIIVTEDKEVGDEQAKATPEL